MLCPLIVPYSVLFGIKCVMIVYNVCANAKMMLGIKRPSRFVLRAVLNLMRTQFRELNLSATYQRTYFANGDVNLQTIKEVRNVLEELGLDSNDIHENPQLLKIHPLTLEHRGLVLKEGGFQVLVPVVLHRYLYVVKRKVSLLKSLGYIDSETDVLQSFLQHVGKPSLDTLPSFSDDNRFIDIHNTVLKHYLRWRLEVSPSTLEDIFKRYERFNHRSLRYIVNTLDILEHDLGFSKEKILRHGYLIHSHPRNTLDTLKRVPELGGIDIRQVLTQHPKIIMTRTDTIISTANHLKNFGIPDSAVQRCLDIFTLSSNSVYERIKHLQAVPELRVLKKNKLAVRALHYQRKVCDRLSLFKENHIRCTSLHMLSCAEPVFLRYQERDSRTRGADTVEFLSVHLESSESEIRLALNRHPFWVNIPTVNIERTLEMLLEKGFSRKDIRENVQILLYPSEVVGKELEALTDNEEVKAAQQLQQSVSKEPLPTYTLLPNSTKLAMSLYFIERRHHFTGNGVWSSEM